MIDSPISDRDARGAMDDERWERRTRRVIWIWSTLLFLLPAAIVAWRAWNG